MDEKLLFCQRLMLALLLLILVLLVIPVSMEQLVETFTPMAALVNASVSVTVELMLSVKDQAITAVST